LKRKVYSGNPIIDGKGGFKGVVRAGVLDWDGSKQGRVETYFELGLQKRQEIA
jgi:hypothetical protein